MLGYEERELIGQPVEKIFGETFVSAKQPLSGENAAMLFDKGERTYLTKEGRQIPVLSSSSVMLNSKGELQGFVFVAQDITELKIYSNELRRSKEFIETVINSLHDSISIIDVHNYQIIGANNVFIKETGIREEIIGKTCFEATHHRSDPCAPPNDTCPLRETVQSGNHAVAEHTHYDSYGGKNIRGGVYFSDKR